MNDMELIEGFCAEQAPPRPERLAAARARVVAAIEDAAPSGPAPSGSTRALRQMRRRARACARRILTQPRLAISAAVAAAATVAVIVASVTPWSASGTGITLDAATVLHRAAKGALAQPVPRDNQFIYTEVRSVGGRARRSQTVQTWLSVDGSKAGAQRLTPCDIGRQVHATCLYKAPRFRGSPALVSYAWVKTLPTDPGTLLAYLERNSGCNHLLRTPMTHGLDRYDAAYSEIYVILASLYLPPPKVSAALFDAAAKIPGVTVLPYVVDAAGGQGIAVAMTPAVGPASGRTRYELIFDPHTYRFIGSQAIAVGSSARGTVLLASELLNVGFVNTEPTRYTMSSLRFMGGPPGSGPAYLPWPPPYTWGPSACIFGSLRFY
jgi:hypothetical protein